MIFIMFLIIVLWKLNSMQSEQQPVSFVKKRKFEEEKLEQDVSNVSTKNTR